MVDNRYHFMPIHAMFRHVFNRLDAYFDAYAAWRAHMIYVMLAR